MAQEVLLSEFDYFTPTQVLAQITSEYTDVIPAANGTAGVIDFTITGEPNVYRDLNNSYLEIKCKVTAADGTTNVANNAAVAPVNNLLHSMFSSVSVTMCGKQITEQSTHYPYRAMIETLLTYPTDVLRTRGQLQGWCLDEDAAAMDRVLLAATQNPNVEPNPAFLKRNAMVTGSRILTLVGRIHADVFHQPLDIPPECDLRVTLVPSDSKFALQAAGNADFKLVIVSARLLVRSKVGSPEFIAAHQRMLNTRNYRLPLNTVHIHTYAISQGLAEFTIPNPFTKLPNRIVIGLVSQDRATGAYNLNPYKFENFGLKDIAVKVAGELVPRDGVATNYATGDY